MGNNNVQYSIFNLPIGKPLAFGNRRFVIATEDTEYINQRVRNVVTTHVVLLVGSSASYTNGSIVGVPNNSNQFLIVKSNNETPVMFTIQFPLRDVTDEEQQELNMIGPDMFKSDNIRYGK